MPRESQSGRWQLPQYEPSYAHNYPQDADRGSHSLKMNHLRIIAATCAEKLEHYNLFTRISSVAATRLG